MNDLRQAFWVFAALALAGALFFAIVGGGLQSTVFVLAMCGCALLLALHGYLQHRQHDELNLSPDARRLRERRGF